MAALDHGRMYSLYGIFAHHDDHGAPLQFVDSNPKPQQLKDGNHLVDQFPGRAVKANALVGVDTQLWETARGYLAIIRWRLTPIPLAEAVPGPFHAGADALPGDLVNCVLKVVRDKLDNGADANKGKGHKHAGVKLATKRMAALAHADATMSTEGFTPLLIRRAWNVIAKFVFGALTSRATIYSPIGHPQRVEQRDTWL